MRKINTQDFHIATRTTSREVNRRIALTLIREHQPISRAELARKMDVPRPVVTMLVNDLIGEDTVYQGATTDIARGRKPVMLHVRTQHRYVIAVDVRFSRTYLMLTDFSGTQIEIESFATLFEPARLISEIARRIKLLLKKHDAREACEGIGLVVPGVVNQQTGRVVYSPQLGWREVELRRPLAAKTGLNVLIENAPMACALAQVWMGRGETNNFVYVTVSDGVGVGVVAGGELLRGHANTAGEFGHNPLSFEGPPCLCGKIGCWEAYTSNIATVSRYLKRDLSHEDLRRAARETSFSIEDLIALAHADNAAAIAALRETGRYLGLGLASVINAVNPARVFIGGEITAAWNLINEQMRAAVKERTLTAAAGNTPIIAERAIPYPRLRGATALIAAPAYAAPRVA